MQPRSVIYEGETNDLYTKRYSRTFAELPDHRILIDHDGKNTFKICLRNYGRKTFHVISKVRLEYYILTVIGFVLCLSFVVNGKLFWGVDNMHLVEKELGNDDAAPLRLVRPPISPQSATLTIYHDLASPWSFIGSTQVGRLCEVH